MWKRNHIKLMIIIMHSEEIVSVKPINKLCTLNMDM